MKGGTAPPKAICTRTSTSHNPILEPHGPARSELQPMQRAWPSALTEGGWSVGGIATQCGVRECYWCTCLVPLPSVAVDVGYAAENVNPCHAVHVLGTCLLVQAS